MKWFVVILGLYMTILAVLPCKDKDDSMTIQKTAVRSSQQTGHGACQETCPPFCSCTCCSTTRNLTRTFTILPVRELPIARTYIELRVKPVCEQARPIWQPPQLS